MPEITLKVTLNGLKYKEKTGRWSAAQIAIVKPAFAADKNNRVDIDIFLNWDATLSVGDTHAIWYSHNKDNSDQCESFKRLYMELAETPGQEKIFLYEQP